MLLRSLRLNPFAGFGNQTFEFTPGLNVILGPNEAGKSTLVNALFGVLQLADKPRDFDNQMAALYLPKAGGDSFRVFLRFNMDEEEYELKWSLIGKTALELENRTTGAVFLQEAQVRQMLGGFRHYHPDVYRDVLVIRQGGLEGSCNIFSQDKLTGKGLDQLLDRLRQRAVSGGGFSPEVMMRRLDVLLGDTAEGYTGQWDLALNRPLANRGLDNPWKVKVGRITQAWYTWKQAEKDRLEVEATVRQLERLTTENEAAQQKLSRARAFVEERREEYESRERLARLLPEMERWEQARKSHQEKLNEAQAYKKDLESARAALETAQLAYDALQNQEKDMARARVLTAMREVVTSTESLVQEYKQTNTEFRNLPEIPKEKIAEARELDRAIVGLEAQLKAVQLSLEAEAVAGPTSIWIEENGARREVALPPGTTVREVLAGRVALETGSVRIRVQPDRFDAGTLLKQKEEKTQSREAILNQYLVPTVADLEAVAQRRAELDNRCHTLTNTITGLTNKAEFRQHLGLETVRLRDLEAALADVDFSALPDPKTWAVAVAEARAAMEKPRADARRLEDWLARNPPERLQRDLMEAETRAAEAGEKARREPWFDKPGEAGFADRYRQAEQQVNFLTQTLASAGREIAALEQQLDGKPDLAELRAQEEAAHTAFEARLEEYKAYKLIKAKLTALTAESDEAVYGPVRERLEHYIALTTGSRYAPVGLEGGAIMPERFARGRYSPFRPEQLSQGTSESLALATRLALAEFYLEGRQGFLILDDVMVNMDPERIAMASVAIRSFAERFQVLYCTCHPAHAEALGGNRIELPRMG